LIIDLKNKKLNKIRSISYFIFVFNVIFKEYPIAGVLRASMLLLKQCGVRYKAAVILLPEKSSE
jgi:hypothetical protein